MTRLTNSALALVDFQHCQLCGRERETVLLTLWQQCDDHDKPEDRFLLTCRDGACEKRINDHPRLYIEVSVQDGAPGRWRLICDDCDHRQGFRCLHPDLRANGGPGLTVKHSGPTGYVCGTGGCRRVGPTAFQCVGKRVGGQPA
jgi:hypothetical protein